MVRQRTGRGEAQPASHTSRQRSSSLKVSNIQRASIGKYINKQNMYWHVHYILSSWDTTYKSIIHHFVAWAESKTSTVWANVLMLSHAHGSDAMVSSPDIVVEVDGWTLFASRCGCRAETSEKPTIRSTRSWRCCSLARNWNWIRRICFCPERLGQDQEPRMVDAPLQPWMLQVFPEKKRYETISKREECLSLNCPQDQL